MSELAKIVDEAVVVVVSVSDDNTHTVQPQDQRIVARRAALAAVRRCAEAVTGADPDCPACFLLTEQGVERADVPHLGDCPVDAVLSAFPEAREEAG